MARARRAPRAAQLGVTPVDYARMLDAQGGHCALCPGGGKTRAMHVDHDHRTMQVRGLLCQRDNRVLPAWVTPEWLRRAADYIENGGTANVGAGRPVDIRVHTRAGEMMELRASGMSLAAIGDRYGMSRQRVHQIIGGAT